MGESRGVRGVEAAVGIVEPERMQQIEKAANDDCAVLPVDANGCIWGAGSHMSHTDKG